MQVGYQLFKHKLLPVGQKKSRSASQGWARVEAGSSTRADTHLGFSQSELIACTLLVIVSADMSVKFGSRDCRRRLNQHLAKQLPRGWRRSYARSNGPSRIQAAACSIHVPSRYSARPAQAPSGPLCPPRHVIKRGGGEPRRAGCSLDRAHLGRIRGRSLVDLLYNVGHTVSSWSQLTVRVGRKKTADPEHIFRELMKLRRLVQHSTHATCKTTRALFSPKRPFLVPARLC